MLLVVFKYLVDLLLSLDIWYYLF